MSKSESEARVPASFQALFILTNAGKQVDKALPNKMSMKTFRRWRAPSSKKSTEARDAGVPAAVQTIKNSGSAHTRNHISPQQYLTSLLKNRGYNTSEIRALDTAYYNRPTPLQLASHGSIFQEGLRTNNDKLVREMLDQGVSPNACNKHGESVVHMVCRMGLDRMLQLLLEYKASVQVADDCGRTPLHDACWAKQPNFDIVDMVLAQDPQLFYVADSDGFLPLQYLRDENWTVWTKFLMSRKNTYWPDRDIKKDGLQDLPELAKLKPHSRPAVNPASCSLTTLEAIAVVTKGKEKASACKADFTTTTEDETADEEHEYESDYGDDDADSVDTFDEDEMAEILGNIGAPGGSLAW